MDIGYAAIAYEECTNPLAIFWIGGLLWGGNTWWKNDKKTFSRSGIVEGIRLYVGIESTTGALGTLCHYCAEVRICLDSLVEQNVEGGKPYEAQ